LSARTSPREFSNVFDFAQNFARVIKLFSGKNYSISSVADMVRCSITAIFSTGVRGTTVDLSNVRETATNSTAGFDAGVAWV